MPSNWYLDPNDTVDFSFDWASLENGTGESNWLDRDSSPAEAIESAVVSSQDSPGPIITATTVTDTVVIAQITASDSLAGGCYPILCQITTTAGQVKSKTANLFISNL